jgi:hypothetical protein
MVAGRRSQAVAAGGGDGRQRPACVQAADGAGGMSNRLALAHVIRDASIERAKTGNHHASYSASSTPSS